jgi:surface protein
MGIVLKNVNITGGKLSGVVAPPPPPAPLWVRPSDWLTMPTVQSTDDTFVSLHAVFPSGNNFAAFRFTTSTGQYQVDWGDGTVDLVNSNVTAEHTYDYATYDTGNATLSTRGYKQAIITVTPVTGNLLTANFQLRRTTTPAQNQAYATGFLDCILSMPNVTNSNTNQIVFGGATVIHSYVERFNLLNIGNAVRFDSLLSSCRNLQKIEINANTSTLNNLTNVFTNCIALEEIPLFDTSNVTELAGCFQNTFSLKYLPNFDFTKVTNLTNTFNGSGIIEVNLDLPEASIFNQCFLSCSRLKKVTLLNTNKVTVFRLCFWNCSSLQSVVINNINTINSVNLESMFFGCGSLQKAPFFNTASVINMNQMFSGCRVLNTISNYDTTNVTNITGFATDCTSLDRTDIICRTSVNFNNCQLSQVELVNIFNNLIDRSATTAANINITGNWGATALTAGERNIALNKNWTITG